MSPVVDYVARKAVELRPANWGSASAKFHFVRGMNRRPRNAGPQEHLDLVTANLRDFLESHGHRTMARNADFVRAVAEYGIGHGITLADFERRNHAAWWTKQLSLNGVGK